MDRNSLIGVILISIVIGVWVFLQSTTTTRDVTPQKTEQQRERQAASSAASEQTARPSGEMQGVAWKAAADRTITIRTNLYRVRVSSHGATVRSWQLLQYRPWYAMSDSSKVVDVVSPGAYEFGFSFRTVKGAKVRAKDVPFSFDLPTDSVTVEPGKPLTLTATAHVEGGGTITRTYTFKANAYDVATEIRLEGMENVIPATNRNVLVEWAKGIRYQEGSSVDESNNAVAIISTNGSADEIDAADYNTVTERSVSGTVDYVATRSKYFTVALIPPTGFDGTVYTKGTRYGLPNEGFQEVYSLLVKVPSVTGVQSQKLTLYVGPMQYDTLAQYGLTNVMNFGWKWIVKPIGEYFMLPALKLIHSAIPNYGIAIIIFALFMKVLLYPLSITQMKSARKMQLVAPLMNEIREKYKDDMQSQQQEMMKLYSEYGINPAGGCLPLLLQMPFLYALYAVLNLNIDLRQAGFLPMWLTDLSVPDVILSLPFKLPLFNIDKFSGLALLMGATLFVQQKQAVTDPRQKAMVYMMPVMLTLMFSTLPSGLNLYYFVFNVVAIAQQIWQTKFSKNALTLADLRKAPKKESWLQRKMREAQQIAEAQGRSIPGQKPQSKPSKNGPKGNRGRADRK